VKTSYQKVVLISTVWPESTSSAAGVRDEQLLQAFTQAGKKCYCLSPSQENSFSEKIKKLGIEVKTILLNDPSFDQLIKEINPDVVIFDRFLMEEQFGWRVKQNCPQAMRIIDTQDIHFLRKARQRALSQGVELSKIFNADLDFYNDGDCLRELASILRSDVSFVLSDFEKNLLITRFNVPASKLYLLRFFYDMEIPPSMDFKKRRNFVFIGNFRHPPNLDCIQWMKKEIWKPIQKKLPGVQFHVYGAYPSAEVSKMHDPTNGWIMKGGAKDAISTLLGYRYLLAPLRFGAGIKGKITDSWIAGTPVITTPIGSEGMHDSLPFGGQIVQSSTECIKVAIEEYENKNSWINFSKLGSEIVSALYCNPQTIKNLIQFIQNTFENRIEAQKNDWLSQMLWHESMKSTEYFSRWIEAKNKNKL